MTVSEVFYLYKFKIGYAAAAAAAVMLCGCTEIAEEAVPVSTEMTAPEERPYPAEVGSLIFNEQPQTVGSLSPAVTEIICELGFADKLTGISIYCDYPEEIAGRDVLGSAANPDAKAVIDSAPQLLISQSPIAKKDITAIEEAGTRVLILPSPLSVEELYACYNDIAAVFCGRSSGAEAADDAMRPLTDALRQAEGSISSFVYIMSPELAAATDNTFAGNFFSHFGVNAAADGEDIVFTEEELIGLSPEWIIVPESIKDELPEGIYGMQAFLDGKVITLDSEALERIERPTSRLSGTVYEILEQIDEISR